MSAEIIARTSAAPLTFTEDQSQMIRDAYANGATDGEFAVLMEIAKARRLNPLLKQLHFVKRWDKDKARMVWATQVSIDGLRAIAERTGLYAGQDEPEFVELPDRGTVTTFAIINIPFPGQRIKPPYVAAYVLLDGADIPFLHLVTEIDAAEVRMGMRVQAVWKPREEWGLGIDNISHFKPSGEPDADYDTYKHHL